MSRTTLCMLTASVLAALSVGTMALRFHVLGEEVRRPIGPGTWKITLAVQGTSTGQARVWTTMPLSTERQHLIEDRHTSEQMSHRPPEARHPERRRVVWATRPGSGTGAFEMRSEFLVGLHLGRSAGNASSPLYAAPDKGQFLSSEPLIESSDERITAEARRQTATLGEHAGPIDTVQALFRFVEQKVKGDVRLDGPAVSAATALAQGSGDRCARARLLAALLRNRSVPARVVSGVTLTRGAEQQTHYWVEAFVFDHWMPMCPYHHHFGRVPSTFVVFAIGDRPAVTAKRVTDLKYAFLVERLGKEGAAEEKSSLRRGFESLSLYQLPTGDRRLVEVLLLMPLAALIVCVSRNIIGLGSFGTFTPALIGLAFHDLNSWPGLFVFVSILMVGWFMRRILDRYHLLQVPRVATMLTLIMSVLILLIVLSNLYGATTTRYISLFPIVILTGMVERFWTLENEDSLYASFRTLGTTMLISLVIALVLSRPWIVQHLFCYPETLGLLMACQLLIGRYTGYRVMELIRFRDFLQPPPPPGYSTS
jgi:transglutaminase-like putative cysteine protease